MQIQLSLNCFTACESSVNEGADLVGLFPGASFFNHSCRPSLTKLFSGFELVLQTAREVAPGEELTIGYTSFMTPFFDRTQYLEKHYGFRCGCRLCKYEAPRDYFRTLHKAFKEKLNSLSQAEFGKYFARSFPVLGRLEQQGLIRVRAALDKAFYAGEPSKDSRRASESAVNLFLKLFIDANFHGAAKIAQRLCQSDEQSALKAPESEEERLHRMLKILNENHARVGASFVGRFISEVRKLFGKKNLVVVGFMTAIEAECLRRQRFSASYELSAWHTQVMKRYIEISGDRNLSVIGLLFFKLAKLERLLDRADRAFVFAGFGLELLGNYFGPRELQDLLDVRREAADIIQRLGINLDSKSRFLRREFFPGQ